MKLYNESEVSQIVNESFGTLFPKKTNSIEFKRKETYSEEVKTKLIALECALDQVQGLIGTNQNVVAGNYSQFDALLDRLYSLIKEVEMLKQNGKNF
jgi:hypothetical protein